MNARVVTLCGKNYLSESVRVGSQSYCEHESSVLNGYTLLLTSRNVRLDYTYHSTGMPTPMVLLWTECRMQHPFSAQMGILPLSTEISLQVFNITL